jgi:capsular polysaccharide biosynthesis protein
MIHEPLKPKHMIRNMFFLVLIPSLFIGVVVYVVSLFLIPKYQAETKVLITYTTEKNGDYNQNSQDVAEVFAQIINSKSFVEDLFSQAGVAFDSLILEDGIENHISAEVSKDSPVVEIKLFHSNKEELKKIAKAVLDVLNNKKYNLGK